MEGIINAQIKSTDPEDVEELNLEEWKGASISLPNKNYLERFENLDYISFSNSGLKSLENFPKLSKLIKLDLNDNQIKGGLEVLGTLTELMQLNLSNNQLNTVDQFQPLSSLGSLVYLDIRNCPITNIRDYRNKLFEIIPSLQVIDGIDRNGDEASLSSGENSEELNSDFDDVADDLDDSDQNDVDSDDDEDSDSEIDLRRRPVAPNPKEFQSKKK
jgi:Leucine-rich repeat (LRR) protein